MWFLCQRNILDKLDETLQPTTTTPLLSVVMTQSEWRQETTAQNINKCDLWSHTLKTVWYYFRLYYSGH